MTKKMEKADVGVLFCYIGLILALTCLAAGLLTTDLTISLLLGSMTVAGLVLAVVGIIRIGRPTTKPRHDGHEPTKRER